jgi:hypothetical protein
VTKSGKNIPKNRCRTTIAEPIDETLAELPFIGDQVVCLSHGPITRMTENRVLQHFPLRDLQGMRLRQIFVL